MNFNFSAKTRLNGITGKLLKNINRNWLIGLRETNPAILDMYHQRDIKPYRDLLHWSGEFAGKYITSAFFNYKATGDKELFEYIRGFLDELMTCQDDEGYLGCWPRNCRLTGSRPETPYTPNGTWDSWAHYHVMYGLILWYLETENKSYLDTACRIADFFMKTFYRENGFRLVETGSTEMNLAPYHSFAMLYNITGEKKYLDFALEIEKDFDHPTAGNYMKWALEKMEFYTCPKPRWESLHVIMGMAEMYIATGDEKYLTAAEFTLRSILRTDVHNTGAFSTEEAALGTPYRDGNVETCCVVAYDALAYEVYMQTLAADLADFLEIAHYNACVGYYSPTGRWSTYNTPMNGVKRSSCDSINFQCRPGSPELNCCSVNAPRGVAQIARWAVIEKDDCVYINAYEALESTLPSGKVVVTGGYPFDNTVTLQLALSGKKVALRIPQWSHKTLVTRGGETACVTEKGYYLIERAGEEMLTVTFDFSPKTLKGGDEKEGFTSVYVGPMLYAADAFDNPEYDVTDLPALDVTTLTKPELHSRGGYTVTDGSVVLRDFASAGMTGSRYVSWLKVK